MSPEQVFAYRYEQMCDIAENGSVMNLLDLAVILRQFLIDGRTAVDEVNRKYRIKVRYEVGDSTEQMIEDLGLPRPAILWSGDIMLNQETHQVSRDQLLAHSILYANGSHYSVKDIIKTCANRLGGVHVSNPENDDKAEAVIRDSNEKMIIGGAPLAFRSLVSIADIVGNGLEQLYNRTQEKKA